jgi:arylsulfatase A-like enzyme/Tfp pilus assembly protein PilF
VVGLALAVASPLACARDRDETVPVAESIPSILLVTLDTTRADAMGWESDEIETPALEALAARGVRFEQAHATAPLTLPSHTSMLTGLYPREHGIHENSRVFDRAAALLAPRLRDLGYRTAAFVSALPLARQFGLGEGFQRYDDAFGAANERRAADTTDLAIEYLAQPSSEPVFLWVHYFDPHDPYAPPEPFRSRYAQSPYLGEVAYMDAQLARLVAAFDRHAAGGQWRILVAGDHGESLGEHGEALHGNLLYRGVVRVPLVIAGSGLPAGEVVSAPVSTRRVHDTILAWAGASGELPGDTASLLDGSSETVFAEGMKPFLEYGWQPQVMALQGSLKAIWSGQLEVYDLAADPRETRNLAGQVEIDPELLARLRDYPVPASGGGAGSGGQVDEATRARLAALGYTGGEGAVPPRRESAPAPKDMTHLFADLDLGSGLFLRHEYARAIPVFERLAAADPLNVTVHLRLAVASSVLGRERSALASFERALALAPESLDVRHYLGLHQLRAGRLTDAEGLLAEVLAAMPDRLPALEAMAEIRKRQGRLDDARLLLERAVALVGTPASSSLARLGELRMAGGDTAGARDAFEGARASQGAAFAHDLELGVLYLAERRFAEARDALDRVPDEHPGYPMALFKRAQVSVLLNEPDRAERIAAARRHADATTRELIKQERLFNRSP